MATEPAAFTPQSFHDLVRLLEQHPEWRAQLRQLVLTEELLQLPALVRDLAEAQKRTEERLDALVEAQRRTEETLRALIGRVDHLETRFDRLESKVDSLDTKVDGLESKVDGLEAQMGQVRGDTLETRYRRHSGSYFGPLLRRARAISQDELDDLLEEGATAGTLTEKDIDEVRLADLIVRGRRPVDRQEAYLVVEVSAGVGTADVVRAARRADLLSRLRPATPVVAGDRSVPEAGALARRSGVWQVLDGRVVDPNEA
jgi:predicted RecB family endonuclease